MTFDEQFDVLIANLGVYGCWLTKHGRRLPQHIACVQELMQAYAEYREDDREAMALMLSIDRVVSDLMWEPVGTNYDTALRSLWRYEVPDEESLRTAL